MRAAYSDEELAALLVLLFKVTSSSIDTFPDVATAGGVQLSVESQLRKYLATPNGGTADTFDTAIKAFVGFYDVKHPDQVNHPGEYKNRYAVHAVRQSLAALLTAISLEAGVTWGDCKNVAHTKLSQVAGKSLAQPAP